VRGLERHAHGLDDGVGLRRRARARDDEEVRDRGQAPEIEDDEVFGVLVERGAGRQARGGFSREGCHQGAER